ncbi:MAG: hypothetical protein PVH19_15410 [Planctomycetia bacterium]|jgi:hypothetical protein
MNLFSYHQTMHRSTITKHATIKLAVLTGILLSACLTGCGLPDPPATVEGTLQLNGKPLDNCLVTFFPEPDATTEHFSYASGVTDKHGVYRLQTDTQQDGAAVGWHRVTVQDLSASSGIPRQDHGSAEIERQKAAATPARPSRTRRCYLSTQTTPLRKELKSGHQTLNLDLE